VWPSARLGLRDRGGLEDAVLQSLYLETVRRYGFLSELGGGGINCGVTPGLIASVSIGAHLFGSSILKTSH
jgi:hypothetical protein